MKLQKVKPQLLEIFGIFAGEVWGPTTNYSALTTLVQEWQSPTYTPTHEQLVGLD